VKVLQFPLVRVTLFFVFGILFAQITKPKLHLISLLLFCAIVLVIFSYFFSKRQPYFKSQFGLVTFFTSFLIGAFALVCTVQTNNSNHYVYQIHPMKKDNFIEILIKEKLKTSIKNDRYVAQIQTLNGKKSYGKLLVNIAKDSTSNPVEIGTFLKIKGSVYLNKSPNNPNQFDYGKYLENQQIYGQIYTDYSHISKSQYAEKSITYYAGILRNRIVHNLEKNHFNETELSVVNALILGQQQDISQEINRDYQYAGAVHILSVSGLHVGFILLFITFLLKPIPNTKRNSFLKLIIVVISLWSFGIIAGLAPSVVRSVTMFSFVAIGLFLRRSVNIYHTLLVSALLILLFRPSFLFDVGFQLSYLALFFIVWLQPLLTSFWTPKNKVITYFWEIITVSFAAQIGTFPLSVYYFHQFPGLFIVTNIIILPMLSVILCLGVVVMILAAFDFVWMPLLKSLEWSIWLLNKIISWVASFQDFVVKDISFNWQMMCCSYLLIFSIILWFMKPTCKKLILSLVAIVLVQIAVLKAEYSNQKKSELIVFNKKKNTIITERDGTKVTVFATKSFEGSNVLKSYLVANFCKIQEKKSISNLYYFKNKKLYLLDSSGVYLDNVKPEILLLTNSPRVNLERLFISWKPQQVVVDASNYKSYVKLWKATCRKEKIPFHDTSEKGFYKL
jgi:competence protein ComEC